MAIQDHLSELVSYGIPTLITVLTLPSIWRFGKSIRGEKVIVGSLYEDRDGVATEESMKKFSTKVQYAIISIGVALGLASSFAYAVVATVYNSTFGDVTIEWLLFWSWTFAFLQTVDVIREIQVVDRYERGVFSAFSFFLLAIFAGFTLAGDVPPHPGKIIMLSTLPVQIVAAVTTGLTFLTIDRRPDVFTEKGQVVERQFQTSLLTRYSYNWSSELLDVASKKLIDLDDLPAMDAHIRSKDVKDRFQSITGDSSSSLWLQIFWAFKWQLAFQWVMVIASSIMDSAPQLAVLQLLRYLEARTEFGPVDPKAWLCVGSLFLATVLETLVDYRVSWLMWSDLGVPIRSTLTALIFEKMMKTKDCKEPPAAEAEKEDPKKPKENGHKDKPKPSKEQDKKDAAKKKAADQSQQDIINMFAVDTNQVGVFGAINQFYVMFASKFVVSVVFLWLLVGWQSLGAGMIAIVLVFPVNKLIATRYGRFQKELMKGRDKQSKTISECLQGIRQIKFSAMEAEWTGKINEVREEVLTTLWKTKLNNLYMMLGSDIAPVFLTIFSLATYSYVHGALLPSVAFTALGVFMQLEGVLGMVPFLFMLGMNAKVSCDRIDGFLKGAEKSDNTLPGESVVFENASVSFPSKSNTPDEEEGTTKFVLRDLDLSFPNNALSIISGPTGSGKSLLLAAILGEVDLLDGKIYVPRPPSVAERFDSQATPDNWLIPTAIAFVAQTPWIENASIKDNILFGLPYFANRYNQVLEACALTQDLAILDDGDLTEVGAQGISLSGGQKWRLTLARAFYSRAGILILDDVFSALDAHVGKHIYDNALMGELSSGRTRILATHHVSLCLPRAEYAVQLSADGKLEHAGSVKELQQSGKITEILQTEHVDAKSQPKVDDTEASEIDPKDAKPAPKKLVEDENRESGSVKRSVYTTYLKATGGIPFWMFVFMFYIIAQGLTLSRSWWIKIWTSSYEHTRKVGPATIRYSMQSTFMSPNQIVSTPQPASTFTDIFNFDAFSFNPFSGASVGLPGMYSTSKLHPNIASFSNLSDTNQLPIDVNHRTLGFYLAGYVIISMISTFVDVGKTYVVFRGSLRASRKLFNDMTYGVLRTPLRWLDTVPTGRVLNRFTADIQALDGTLSSNFAQVSSSILSIIGIMVAAFFVSPYIIILALVLLTVCSRIALRYIRGARSFKRLESIQKSPMISHFTASLQGLSTIRAFGNTEVFENRMHYLVDSFATTSWHNWLFNSWVGFRMAMVGSVFSTLVAAFIVSTRGVDASLAGFALSFALSYRSTVNSTLRQVAATELDMNAAERIFEYTNLEIEDQSGSEVRASWPEKGELEVDKLEVGYADGLPSILKGLSFKAEMNQRVGIVGRTGAGKSTLSLALFRFLKARSGSIFIDGVDISKIKLHDLRTRLAIIPQDPVLFSGTIRSNLDPFDQFSDVQLREALQRVHLIPSADNTPVPEPAESSTPAESSSGSSATATEIAPKENTNIFLNLQSPISSSGANLSQGQKQLLCLARAILSRPKLLLLDEATSAVDKQTDTLIQRSIREEFANTTLLVVAHRLSTVMDFDRILVMKDGVAAEFGTPRELLSIEEGVFKGMVAQSGEKRDLERIVGL